MPHHETCKQCSHQLCAKRVPIFSTLNSDEISKVVQLINRKQYSRGELILLEGNNLEGLVIINSGQVKAFRNTPDGKEQILYIFSSGEFFGEKNLLRKQEATYSVEALEETNICMIRKHEFQQLLRDYPEIGLKVMEELCNRLERLENAIENMGAKNVESRVNTVLLEFATKYGKEHPNGLLIELPLSREGIANYIGLTRETVSRKLNHLQDEGVIEMIGNKKILLINPSVLRSSIE